MAARFKFQTADRFASYATWQQEKPLEENEKFGKPIVTLSNKM
jgi:hypothetical protein